MLPSSQSFVINALTISSNMDKVLVFLVLLATVCGCKGSDCTDGHLFCLYGCCADGFQFCCYFAVLTGCLAGFAFLATVAVICKCFCRVLARMEISSPSRDHIAMTAVGINNPTYDGHEKPPVHRPCPKCETVYVVLTTPTMKERADAAA